MSFQFLCALCAVFLATAYAQQQVPGDTTPPAVISPRTDPDKRGTRPLTAVEERDRAIRRYDPRSNADPLEREQDRGLLAPRQDAERSPLPDQRVLPAPRPLPGSVAASGQSDFVGPGSQGPRVVDPTQPDSEPEYNGPAVLSRNYTLSRPSIPREVKWTPFLGVSETFASAQQNIGSPGNTAPPLHVPSTFGTTWFWGVSGRHLWKRDQISADYRGGMTQSSGGQTYNGGNHSLEFQYAHVLSRHMIASVSQSFSSTSQSYSLQAGLQPSANTVADSNLAISPGAQPFDQGLRQMSTFSNLRWQRSARMAISMTGGVFFADRRGVAVGGTTGYQAQSDITYRYSRKMTVGVYYSHTNYLFTKHASLSNSDTMGGIFSYAFNRTTQLRLRAGSSLIETQSLIFVPFPTQLALILGQAGGIASLYHQSRMEDISAELARDLGRRRTVSVSYAKGLSPGNGILLTSSHEALSGAFNTILPWGFLGNVSSGGDRLSAIGSTIGSYSSRHIQFGASKQHRHGMTSNYSVDIRQFNAFTTSVPQLQIRITTGVSWSPGENRFWK